MVLLLLKLIKELRYSQWPTTDFRRSAGEQRPPRHSYKYPLLVKGHLLPEVFVHCSPKTSVHSHALLNRYMMIWPGKTFAGGEPG